MKSIYKVIRFLRLNSGCTYSLSLRKAKIENIHAKKGGLCNDF